MPTILITGTSSGFGLETARYFLDRDWTVIAAMRTPRADLLSASERVRIIPLDVTDPNSIARAVELAGPIDALVNNAGIGILNALEGTTPAAIKTLFATNTLGTIAMTQAFVPQFRARRAGIVVNVTSAVTILPLPLLSVYTASKAAVNAFTESLALELEPFNVRLRLVLPGAAPDTNFGRTAQALMGDGFPAPYAELGQQAMTSLSQQSAFTTPQDVAAAIWDAVHDAASPMHIPAGADALAMAAA